MPRGRTRGIPRPVTPAAPLGEAVCLRPLRDAFCFPRLGRPAGPVQLAPHVGEGGCGSTVQPSYPDAVQAGQARQVLKPTGVAPAVVDATFGYDKLLQRAGPPGLLAHIHDQVECVRNVQRLQMREALQDGGLDPGQARHVQAERAHACELQQRGWDLAWTAHIGMYGQMQQAGQRGAVAGVYRAVGPVSVAPMVG